MEIILKISTSKKLAVLLFIISTISSLTAQDINGKDFYREDQFYFGSSYFIQTEQVTDFKQNGFSGNFQFGFIRDIPLNKTSTNALGIGVGDKVHMLENTWYSVISPESCSSILWRSWDYKQQAAEALKLTSEDMLKNKLIDNIIIEPEGGAHYNPEEIYERVRETIVKDIKSLSKLDPQKRIEKRIEKFCSMGVINE